MFIGSKHTGSTIRLQECIYITHIRMYTCKIYICIFSSSASENTHLNAYSLAQRRAKFVSSFLLVIYAITTLTYNFVIENVKLEEIQRKVRIWHHPMRIKGSGFCRFCPGFCLGLQIRISNEKFPEILNQAHIQLSYLLVYGII